MVNDLPSFQFANELQDLDIGNIGAAKGNSLFSEVEDRRVKVWVLSWHRLIGILPGVIVVVQATDVTQAF